MHHELYLVVIMQALMVDHSWRGAAKATGSIPCDFFIMADGGPCPGPDDRTEVAGRRLQPDACRGPAMEAPSMRPARRKRALAVAGRGSLAGA